jgi:predicted amidohydrolase YtcJ
MGIYAACCRKHPEDTRGPWEAEQCLDRFTALHGFTVGGAHAAGQEQGVGTLAPGMRANFVILDRDILSVPDDQILQTQILATFHAGRPVYVNEAAAPDLAETLRAGGV